MQIDIRWATDPARLQQLAKELVELLPDVIQVTTTPATAAVLRETHTIPVVFSNVSDPIGSGFVESFARPGGNATGFVNLEDLLASKWLELLKELAPQTSQVSIPFNPKTAPQSAFYLKLLEPAALSLALKLRVVQVSDASEIEAEIDQLAKQSNAGLVIIPDIFTGEHALRDLIVARTAKTGFQRSILLHFGPSRRPRIIRGRQPRLGTPSSRANGAYERLPELAAELVGRRSRYHCRLWHPDHPSGKGRCGEFEHTRGLRDRQRPGCGRARGKLEPSGRQYYWDYEHWRRTGTQAAGAHSRSRSDSRDYWNPNQPQ